MHALFGGRRHWHCPLPGKLLHPFDKEVGKRYREIILEPGYTINGYDIIINFLERDISLGPFLKNYLGLKITDDDDLTI